VFAIGQRFVDFFFKQVDAGLHDETDHQVNSVEGRVFEAPGEFDAH
jgi:hypothetical protein